MEKAVLLTAIASESFPELRPELPSPAQLGAAHGFEKYLRALEGLMFGPRHRLLAKATRERNRQAEEAA